VSLERVLSVDYSGIVSFFQSASFFCAAHIEFSGYQKN
jgi:hypothetical protein